MITTIVALACILGLAGQAAGANPGRMTASPGPGMAARHGGEIKAAREGTIYLEAVWPQAGVFRLYIYDARGRPLTMERLHAVTARVVAGGSNSSLALETDGGWFEARIEPITPPARMTVAVTLGSAESETRVTFAFDDFTGQEPVMFTGEPTHIPPTLGGIMVMLMDEDREAHALVDGTPTEGLYVAVTRVVDLALAADRYAGRFSTVRATRAHTAVRAAVRTAWLLHVAADEGSPVQTRLAAAWFRDAVDELVAAFDRRGR